MAIHQIDKEKEPTLISAHLNVDGNDLCRA